MLKVTSEDVCWSIRNVKFDIIKVSYTMRLSSDVCYRSLCVTPFKTDVAKSQEHLEKPQLTGCLMD